MNFKNWLKENFDDEFVLPPGWDDNPKPFVKQSVYDPNDPWSVSRPQEIPQKTPAKKSAEASSTVIPSTRPRPREFPSYVFIYTDDNQLFTHNIGHLELIQNTPELLRKFNIADYSAMEPHEIWNKAVQHALLGRLGVINQNNVKTGLVSFWGIKGELFNQLLKPCLTALVNKGIVDSNADYVRYMYEEPMLVKDVLNKRISNQKINTGGGKPHPMATAMQKHGLLKPGQKWWAPTSENNRQ